MDLITPFSQGRDWKAQGPGESSAPYTEPLDAGAT